MWFFRFVLARRAWIAGVAWVVFGLAVLPAQAQLLCTMPNGVKITQQLGGCPRGAVAAERLDGTPVALEAAGPQQAQGATVAPPRPAPVPVQSAAPAEDEGGLSFGGWLVVVLLGFGLVMAVRGSAGVSGPVMYCTSCGHEGRAKTKTRGSLLIEVVLWLCFLIPGLIYSIWRQGSKFKACTSCGAANLVPLSSPVAKAAKFVAVAPVPGADAAGPVDGDAWEGSFYDVGSQRSASKTVRLIYRAGDGAISERVVDIRAFEPHGPGGLVIGRCHLRNATRTFRFDRMVRVIDEETGEIIPDLQARLNSQWEASPEPVLDALYSKHRDLLKMLLYAAKLDGAMRAAEVDVIARHCVELTGDARITAPLVKELLAALDLPSITSFVRIYNQLRRERPDDAARAARACREIVATQKAIHPAEQAMLDALNRPLPKAGPSAGSVDPVAM